jgi:hypothetical protein
MIHERGACMEPNEFAKKRFGTIAVEKRFISKEQLHKAIFMQISEDVAGKERRRVGSILYHLGHLTMQQVNEVLDFMGEERGTSH